MADYDGCFTRVVGTIQPKDRKVAILCISLQYLTPSTRVISASVNPPSRSSYSCEDMTDLIIVAKNRTAEEVLSWMPYQENINAITAALRKNVPRLYEYTYHYAGFDDVPDNEVVNTVLSGCEYHDDIVAVYLLKQNRHDVVRGVVTFDDAESDYDSGDEYGTRKGDFTPSPLGARNIGLPDACDMYPRLTKLVVLNDLMLPANPIRIFAHVTDLYLVYPNSERVYPLLAGLHHLTMHGVDVMFPIIMAIDCSHLQTLVIRCRNANHDAVATDPDTLEQRLRHICTFTRLKTLEIRGVPDILTVPACIGDLVELCDLTFSDIQYLQSVHTDIVNCIRLRTLNLSRCDHLVALPGKLFDILSLVDLDLRDCIGLVELPDNCPGKSGISVLKISGCKKLARLPLGLLSVGPTFRVELLDNDALIAPPWRTVVGPPAAQLKIVQDAIAQSKRFPENDIRWTEEQHASYFSRPNVITALLLGLRHLDERKILVPIRMLDMLATLEELRVGMLHPLDPPLLPTV